MRLLHGDSLVARLYITQCCLRQRACIRKVTLRVPRRFFHDLLWVARTLSVPGMRQGWSMGNVGSRRARTVAAAS